MRFYVRLSGCPWRRVKAIVFAVGIEAPSKDGVTDQQVEEIKAFL